MNTIQVQKRNGTYEPLMIEKIRKMINYGHSNTNLDPLEFEQRLSLVIRDGISTRDIQHNLVITALDMIEYNTLDKNLQQLKYTLIAGRFEVLDMYKESANVREHEHLGYDPDFLSFVEDMVQEGIYKRCLIEEYTEEDIKFFGRHINHEYDMQYSYSAVTMLRNNGYLVKLHNKTFELIQEAFMANAMVLGTVQSKENRREFVLEAYREQAERYSSLATPMLKGLRIEGSSVSSCFTSVVPDSWDGIAYAVETFGDISRAGGAEGKDLSDIRCMGSDIQGYEEAASGTVSWSKIFNDTAIAVDQLGQRQGAITLALPDWHMDIFDFLNMAATQTEERKAARDVFPQIIVSDLFMKRSFSSNESEKIWTLFDPHEIKKKYNIVLSLLTGDEFEKAYLFLEQEAIEGKLKLVKRIKPAEIRKIIFKNWASKGKPYVFFKDTANRMNPNKHIGLIRNANLCVESFSVTTPPGDFKIVQDGYDNWVKRWTPGYSHICNLISPNISRTTDMQKIAKIYRNAVRYIDASITLTKSPTVETTRHNRDFRVIGIGTIGYVDHLALLNIGYEQSAAYADKLFEWIAVNCILESIELAKEFGRYPKYEGSDWSKNIIMGRPKEWYLDPNNTKYTDLWVKVFEGLKLYGIRNSQLMAIAPNTSTSSIQDSSASVLPVYNKIFIEKSNGVTMLQYPPHLIERPLAYKPVKYIDKGKMTDVLSVIQKWTDTGISSEFLFDMNQGVHAKDYDNLLKMCWEKGFKTIYYVRSKRLSGDVEIKDKTSETEPICIGCAN